MLSTMIINATSFILEKVTAEVKHMEYENIPEPLPPISPLRKVARPEISEDPLVNYIFWLTKDKKWSQLVKEIKTALKKGSINTVERADEILRAIDAAKKAHDKVGALIFGKAGLDAIDNLRSKIIVERTRLTSSLPSAAPESIYFSTPTL